jgi:hypothetical protein
MLTKLKQSGTVKYFISSFEHLNFFTKGMTDAFFHNSLSVASRIKFEPRSSWLHPQTWLEAIKRAKEAQHVILAKSRKHTFFPYQKPTTLCSSGPSFEVPKINRKEMDECQLKGIFYNFDDKYFPKHKCREHKLFMVISKDVSNEEVEVSLEEELPKIYDPTQPLFLLKLNH